MRKTVPFILLIITNVLLMPACEKTLSLRPETEVPVTIRANISETAETKGVINGDHFPAYYIHNQPYAGGSYGIFICKNGTTDRTNAHKANSYNLEARYDGTNWSYYYVSNISDGTVSSSGTDHITLTSRTVDHATADLYAYAPYRRAAYTASGPEAIPYFIVDNNTNQQYDLMYAVQNNPDYTEGPRNIGLNPESGSDLSATFTFKHAFALLAFNFKLRNDSSTGAYGTGTTYTLNNITVTLNDPNHDEETTAKLYGSGTFNAITGMFNNDGVGVSNISVGQETWVSSASSYSTASMMLVPTDVADDELVFTFTVNGQTLQPFKLKRSYVQHGSSGVYGFKSGYKYKFYFTLDNYIYFNGFSVSSDWDEEVLGEMAI